MTTYYSDLALEAAENLMDGKKTFSVSGIRTTRIWRDGYQMTDIVVDSDRGAEALGKPKGHYVTLDLRPYFRREADFFQRAVRCLAREVHQMLPRQEAASVLVVGLGNRALAADAVGSVAVENLLVTRHMAQGSSRWFRDFTPVSALCPGVVASTGIETAELVEAVAAAVKPRAVICVDALCARSQERLCATVQLGDTGIVPGSGVGNHRHPLDRKTLGVPVIALGVPTVIHAATLSGKRSGSLVVTPGDIDSRVRELGRIVGYSITLALQPQLTVEDVTGLLG